ncbi:MAG: GNAT family N-acetyltransferase [Candidatus Coprovivens sp.]
MIRLVPAEDISEIDTMNFICEFIEYNSIIHGCGGLDRYINNYNGWLEHLREVETREVTEESVPSFTYFLVRDNYPIGICNIRPYLNESLRRFGGHIGYSIRPTERGHGYNNINLYLALEILNTYEVDEALLDCTVDNVGSNGTIRNLGGRLLYTDIDPYDNELTNVYSINITNALLNYSRYNGRGEENETNRTNNRI